MYLYESDKEEYSTMATFEIPYGKQHLSFEIPSQWSVDLIAPKEAPALPDPAQAVKAALEAPINGERMERHYSARTVAIALSDKTRYVPHALLLPPLLAEVESLGVSPQGIKLIIANGSHAPMTPDEFSKVVPPELLEKYTVISHNCDALQNLVYLGQTSQGTPVWINRHFIEAKLRITVGTIEPHQFMGFSGGAKTVAIGLGGRKTISANHAKWNDPNARPGTYATNPMRQDVEEIGRLAGIHFALNAVLNANKEVVSVLAGAPEAVMQQGIAVAQSIFSAPIPAPYDLIIATPGGPPKDLNLYQAQKALAHASLAVKEGGAVILAAACTEGIGSPVYEQWMAQGFASHTAVLEAFNREGFQIGPHKAALFARDALRLKHLWLVSELPPETVQRYLLQPASLEQALSEALAVLPPGARIGIMPFANITIPTLA